MTERTQALTWAPSAEVSKRILFYVAVILVMIGAIAFGISFDSVMIAARPVFGDAAWAIPLLLDATLAVLTAAGLVLELNGLRARLPQYFARALIAVTVYANVEPARGLFPRILHGAPPVTWAVLVLIAERTARKLASLTAENQIEPIRRSLWLLRPMATLRIWRRMRIHQLSTYIEGLDRDAARAAVVGRLRLHYGRFWKLNAPLAERIALRLDGRDPAGVAAILRTHTDTAALLSARTLTPALSELAPAPEKIAQADNAADTPAVETPARWARTTGPLSAGRSLPRASRALRKARTTQSGHTGPQQPGQAPEALTLLGQEPDRTAASQASRKRVSVRPGVLALKAIHPDMNADTIADILGVSERTVLRHLSAPEAPLQRANGHAISA